MVDKWELLRKRIEEDVAPRSHSLGVLLLELEGRVEKLEGLYQQWLEKVASEEISTCGKVEIEADYENQNPRLHSDSAIRNT